MIVNGCYMFACLQGHTGLSGRQHTITIVDTPSPAVSVITISDSEDESPTKWLDAFFEVPYCS